MEKRQFDSFPEALAALKAEVGAHSFDPDEYYIVLTPDRYTQNVESALFCGGGSIDTEVLTLSRLAGRVAPSAKTLSREGCVMITARAIAAVKPRLTYYARAAAYPEFAREVYETIGQITSSDADIEKLECAGATAEKLHDLALIKSEYDRLKAGCHDPADRMTALIEALPCDKLIKRSHVYAVGFSDVTRLNARALNAVASCARSFVMFDASPETPRRKSMSLISAPDKVSEYKYVASYVLDYIYAGGKFSDVSVVCAAPRVVTRIFSEYGIPVYKDETEPLAFSEPFAAMDLIYELASSIRSGGALDCDALVSLVKNPFSGCDPDRAELFQNAIYERALKYVPLAYDFSARPGGECASRALELAKRFAEHNDFSEATLDMLDYAGFEKTSQAMSARTDAVAPIRALAELLARYGAHDFDIDARAFRSAAHAVNINSLPRERDCVTVTMPQTLRLTACKVLAVVDFNDGVLPVSVAPGGLLGDDELDGLGGAIEPTVAQQNKRARRELRAVVCNAETALCAYSDAGGAPSAFIPDLAERILRIDVSEKYEMLKIENGAEKIAFFAPTESAARELVARGLTAHSRSVAAAAEKAVRRAAEFKESTDVQRKKTVSVSELSDWFKCPYKRFLDVAVGLGERRRGLSAPDFGTIMHRFMQLFIDEYKKTGAFDTSDEGVARLVVAAASDCNIELNDREFERISSAAVDFARLNARIIEAGEYGNFDTELKFEEDINLPGGVKLKGTIDRLDVSGEKARIIDYKTGSTEFDFKKCYNGCDMQLPLYSAVAKNRGYFVTGMFYVKLPEKYGDKDAMSGVVLRDVNTVLGYDRTLIPDKKRSAIVPASLKADKKGEVSFNNPPKALMPREDMSRLIDVCVANAGKAAEEIASGCIVRSPVVGACDYCPYFGICIDRVKPRSDKPSKIGEQFAQNE